MGRIALLLSFVRVVKNGAKVSDVKVDPGGGANVTAEHFASPGDDSHPLPGDYVATVPIPRTGGEVAVGYVDPLNAPKATAGDKRIYARNAAGAAVVELWLKGDGSAILSNALGAIQLLANGNINLNGVIIDTAGNVTSPATVTALNVEATVSLKGATKEMVAHLHPAGNPPGNTGPNI